MTVMYLSDDMTEQELADAAQEAREINRRPDPLDAYANATYRWNHREFEDPDITFHDIFTEEMRPASEVCLTRCLNHAAVFPSGWESEHKAGPLAVGNGPCEFQQVRS